MEFVLFISGIDLLVHLFLFFFFCSFNGQALLHQFSVVHNQFFPACKLKIDQTIWFKSERLKNVYYHIICACLLFFYWHQTSQDVRLQNAHCMEEKWIEKVPAVKWKFMVFVIEAIKVISESQYNRPLLLSPECQNGTLQCPPGNPFQ